MFCSDAYHSTVNLTAAVKSLRANRELGLLAIVYQIAAYLPRRKHIGFAFV